MYLSYKLQNNYFSKLSKTGVMSLAIFAAFFSGFQKVFACKETSYVKVSNLQKQSLKPATSFKKRLWRRCFTGNFAKFLRTPFLIEHLRWLLLNLCK